MSEQSEREAYNEELRAEAYEQEHRAEMEREALVRQTLDAAIAAIREEKEERTASDHWSGMNRAIAAVESLKAK